MNEQTFDANGFLERMRVIKESFHIVKTKQSNDRNRRRVCSLVVDEFLRSVGGIDPAFFLEANLYHNLKKLNVSCDSTPEEVRLRDLPRSKRVGLKGFNPLKLVSENAEPEDEKPYALTETIIKILTEKEEEEEEDGISTNHKRGRDARALRYLQKDPRFFEKQEGPSFYQPDQV